MQNHLSRAEGNVKKTFLSILAVLFVFSLLAAGSADAQDKKKKGKTTKEMELVISRRRTRHHRVPVPARGQGQDPEGLHRRRGRHQDPEENGRLLAGYQPSADLKKRDKVTVKVERDPEEAGLLALTVRVTGMGELLSDKKKKKKK